MNELRKKNVPVRHLKAGDVLKATGETVMGVTIGLNTPKGKAEVMLRRENGTHVLKLWGKSTTIWVLRK